MRTILIVGAVLFMNLSTAWADENKICTSYLVCGTYQGSGANYDQNGNLIADSGFNERIIITAVDDRTVSVEVILYAEGQSAVNGYAFKINLQFNDKGQFSASDDGQLFATGVCRDFVCSFDFVPFKNELGMVTGNVNIIRFEDSKLKRTMMISPSYDRLEYQRSELKRVR
jgi:hypothetical protein